MTAQKHDRTGGVYVRDLLPCKAVLADHHLEQVPVVPDPLARLSPDGSRKRVIVLSRDNDCRACANVHLYNT